MKAIIPVAGAGSRLRPHTFTLPKVLLNVAGKPILGHILDHLYVAGIRDVTLIVGQMGELIEQYVNSNYAFNTEYVLQAEPRGLGHAVSLGLGDNDREVLVILGDTVFEMDLTQVLTNANGSSLGVREVIDPRRFGVVEIENGVVSRLVEKPQTPKSNLVLVGIYIIRNAPRLKRCINTLFERNLTTRGEFQLTDALQLMVEEGERFSTFPVSSWYDCGKPETLLETNRHLLDAMPQDDVTGVSGAVIVPPVYVHPDAIIERSVIGPHATIAKGAVVRDAMVRDSILGEDARVENALVESSIVGNNSSIVGQFLRYNLGDSSEILAQSQISN